MSRKQKLFIETLRWSGRRYHLTALHRERMLRTSPELRLPPGDMECWLPPVPDDLQDLTVKCRITYDTEIRTIEFEPYSPRCVRSLQMVCDDCIDYHLKYADRSCLDSLRSRRGQADEIIIVKNGLVTDTSYSSLLFKAGDKLYTPATPLLRGVMVASLLAAGALVRTELTPDDILPGNSLGITHALLVNAMMPPGTISPVDIRNIYPPACQ
ncbi:MAG: aminotransferase class IV [Muribaculaceae bacterium]|nr:aminotransferase class IV [Muribaculaceae bacterium]